MAFLNFMKKREEMPIDIDLDMPPEPPKMMMKDNSIEEPVDEELVMPKRAKQGRLPEFPPLPEEEIPEMPSLPEEEETGPELPELPPLPEEEEVPEMPSLPEDEDLPEMPPLPKAKEEPIPELETELKPMPEEMPTELKKFDLPPPPEIGRVGREKKGFFSFLKRKKAEELHLPKIEERIPEMPPLPRGEEFPEMPPLPAQEIGPMPSLDEQRFAPPVEHVEEEIEKPMPVKPVKPRIEKPLRKEIKPVQRPIKRFITIDNFRQIQGDIMSTKAILKDINDFFSELEDVKEIVNKEYLGLNSSLEDIQRKIMFVDKVLFEEGG